MNKINSIKLSLVRIGDQGVIIDGIPFSNFAYVKMVVNETDLLTTDFFRDSFVYFKELKRSTAGTGKYLLFTGVSGIADSAGWDYVDVVHEHDQVLWKIMRDDEEMVLAFSREEYLQEINSLEEEIAELPKDIVLEPQFVIFPE